MPHETFVGRMISTVLAPALSLAVSLPARADVIIGGITVIDGDVPFISDNIDLVGTVPVVGAISANFRDHYMFVTGTEGLSTFDIADPVNPRLTSFIPLPHFENEDVTIGGNLLLISNDKSESAAVLYVSISPSRLRRRSFRSSRLAPRPSRPAACPAIRSPASRAATMPISPAPVAALGLSICAFRRRRASPVSSSRRSRRGPLTTSTWTRRVWPESSALPVRLCMTSPTRSIPSYSA